MEKYLKILITSDPDENRHHILNSYYESGFSYSTNGKVIIRVKGEYGDNDLEKFPLISGFNWSVFDTLKNGITISKDSFKEYKTCDQCSKGQQDVQCDECDGDGIVYFDNDCHEYRMTCKSCDGRGWIQLLDSQKCWHCHGTNIIHEDDFLIGNQPFNPVYIKLLVDNLPGLKFFPRTPLMPDDDEVLSAAFTFNGGHGFIMQVKPYG